MRTVRICTFAVMLLLALGNLASAGVPVPPDDIVELYANVSSGAQTEFVIIDKAGHRGATPYVIPAGKVLIVTDAIITPNVADGLYQGNVDNSGGSENRIRFRLHSSNQAMLHLPFSAGVVFSKAPLAFGFATNPGAFVVRLLGYLN